MKKVLSLVCLSALLATFLFAFVSCGVPNEDPMKAKEALEENGFVVKMSEEDGIIYLDAKSETDAISIQYFATEMAAQDGYERAKAVLNKYYSSDEAYKLAMDKKIGVEGLTYDDFECGILGMMVWMGTSAAISAAK